MTDPADHTYNTEDYIVMSTWANDKIKKLEAEIQSRIEYSKIQFADFAKLNNENNDLKAKIREWEDHHMEWNFADSCSDKRIAELEARVKELEQSPQ